jgi:hypothetical protein
MVSDKTAAYMRTLKLTLALLYKRVLAVGGCLSCDALASGRHDRVGDAAACGTKVSWCVLPPVKGAEPAAEALRFGLNDSFGAEYSSGLKSR